jgi:hypothetical protein
MTNTNTFRAVIPYDREHYVTGARIPPGALTRRRPRLGLVNERRDTLGRVVSVTDTPAGLAVTVELGSTRGRDLGAEHGGYYVQPLIGGRDRALLALEVTAIETWEQAELRPATAPAIAARPARASAPTIPARPDVNLTPDVGAWRFTPRQ